MQRLTAVSLALLLAVTIGCKKKPVNEVGGVSDTTPTPPMATVAESRDTAPAVRDFSFDQRQEFLQSARQQLATIDRQIAELASQAKSKGGAVSDRALADIRASRRVVDRNLRRAGAGTAANWEQLKRGVNQSVDNLNEAIEGAQPK
jgi:acyl-CoA reductase-like NAD-dependent aldehyde dehydrogenase